MLVNISSIFYFTSTVLQVPSLFYEISSRSGLYRFFTFHSDALLAFLYVGYCSIPERSNTYILSFSLIILLMNYSFYFKNFVYIWVIWSRMAASYLTNVFKVKVKLFFMRAEFIRKFNLLFLHYLQPPCWWPLSWVSGSSDIFFL